MQTTAAQAGNDQYTNMPREEPTVINSGSVWHGGLFKLRVKSPMAVNYLEIVKSDEFELKLQALEHLAYGPQLFSLTAPPIPPPKLPPSAFSQAPASPTWQGCSFEAAVVSSAIKWSDVEDEIEHEKQVEEEGKEQEYEKQDEEDELEYEKQEVELEYEYEKRDEEVHEYEKQDEEELEYEQQEDEEVHEYEKQDEEELEYESDVHGKGDGGKGEHCGKGDSSKGVFGGGCGLSSCQGVTRGEYPSASLCNIDEFGKAIGKGCGKQEAGAILCLKLVEAVNGRDAKGVNLAFLNFLASGNLEPEHKFNLMRLRDEFVSKIQNNK
jgi:hypothetical protein